jgi:hypothetical protein
VKVFLKGLLGITLAVGVAAAAHALIKHRRQNRMETVYAFRIPSGGLFIEEDFQNPQLQALRRRERLDVLMKPGMTDLQKILALAKWTSQQWVAGNPLPNYPPWNARVILDRIRSGKTGGFCAQYAFVFGQACQSFGYMVRYLDLASPESAAGHFTTSVYVPSLRKWIVVESEWGYCYRDQQGRFLNELELHDWAIGKRNDPITLYPTTKSADPSFLQLFYYFRYYLRNNYLTVPVFVRRQGTQWGFEPYRLAWSDAYTADTLHLADAIASSDPQDFLFTMKMKPIPEFTWHKRGDFYTELNSLPYYQLCKVRAPHYALVRLVKQDFVHNPLYHRLRR